MADATGTVEQNETVVTDKASPESEGRPVVDLLNTVSEEQASAIRRAIEAGDIVAQPGKVTIRAKSTPGKKFDEYQKYVGYFAQTAKGMAILCNGKIEPATPKPADGKDERTPQQRAAGACDYFNYGFDLDLRQPIRVQLEDSLAGPEKAIEKAVKGLVDGGVFATADEARAFVIAKRRDNALPV